MPVGPGPAAASVAPAPAPAPAPVRAPSSRERRPSPPASTVSPSPERAAQPRSRAASPPDKGATPRAAQIVDILIETLLLDQYVLQLAQYAVDKKEVDAKEEEVRADLKKGGGDFAKMLTQMNLTEAELRDQIAADLRWTKFCNDQAKDDLLKKLFDSEKEFFDGSVVRARHILLTPALERPQGRRGRDCPVSRP